MGRRKVVGERIDFIGLDIMGRSPEGRLFLPPSAPPGVPAGGRESERDGAQFQVMMPLYRPLRRMKRRSRA